MRYAGLKCRITLGTKCLLTVRVGVNVREKGAESALKKAERYCQALLECSQSQSVCFMPAGDDIMQETLTQEETPLAAQLLRSVSSPKMKSPEDSARVLHFFSQGIVPCSQLLPPASLWPSAASSRSLPAGIRKRSEDLVGMR